MPAAVLSRMVRGVSCRDYEGVIESTAEGLDEAFERQLS